MLVPGNEVILYNNKNNIVMYENNEAIRIINLSRLEAPLD